jgi:[ribosomal protein S5]-alanine N-acetyltransferase
MFCFTPFPALTTSRLLLRPLNTEDAPEVFALRSDPLVNKYLERPKAQSIEDALAFIKRIQFGIENGQSIYWVIGFKPESKLIGTICLWNFSEEENKAEIGYELLPHYHGKGIMAEAMTRVVHYGFETLGLQKIEAWTVGQNTPSVRILEQNHFKRDFEAEAKLDRETEGDDTVIYSLLKSRH